jgi:TolA-binding protein
MRGFFLAFAALIVGIMSVLTHTDVIDDWNKQAAISNNYHVAALELSRENRMLKVEISDLKYKLKEMEAKNSFLKIKKSNAKREIASVTESQPMEAVGGKDYVQYEIYQWSPDKLLAIGDKEFQYNNFEKSAQFLNELITRFPAHQKVNDRVLFEAGIAAYESKKYYGWAEKHLETLVKEHPKSKFYRGAKLWWALSKLRQGDEQSFYNTVEEFRLKYRNTQEWKILSKHYEEFTTRYKK